MVRDRRTSTMALVNSWPRSSTRRPANRARPVPHARAVFNRTALLAEADIPYELLLVLDHADPMFVQTDVVLILGANDVVNSSARDDPSSSIYGMPILNVDHAARVIVVKRSLSPGFAGIDNPLFYDAKTLMFFADAKGALEDTLAALKIL
jgi:NAD(P) transhydrogenase subunit beta